MTAQPLTLIEIESIKYKIQMVIDALKQNRESIQKSEANTETMLIEPLFEALGWDKKDWSKRDRVLREEKRGFADYIFSLKGKPVFVLEAKNLGIELEKEGNKQAISYALPLGIPFAVSTNFENLNIFCVEQIGDLNQKKFRVFKSPEEYITRINDLLYLSKRSFENGSIQRMAEGEGRLKERNSMDRSLLNDLIRVRKLISNDIEKTYPGDYDSNEKDEIIQRIIDRLIFIRNCEDRGMGVKDKLRTVTSLTHSEAYGALKNVFREYDGVYNSGLFKMGKDNDCDDIKIDGEIIKKLIKHLYDPLDESFFYDFEMISADILGQVYEQYLGMILAQTKSGKAKLKDGQAHKKEQGIYYTPTYIVDYIVKNTLGETLKDKNQDATKIKVLDIACGSGSFLIKAYDYLAMALVNEVEMKKRRIDGADGTAMYTVKTEILKNNMYGIDLDNKAVEITKLSLLLKASEKHRRLPEEIDNHIQHGNSVVDDESVGGVGAFRWVGDFQCGSFDVVIGNPPYVKARDTKDPVSRKRMEESGEFETLYKMWDLYVAFVERGIKLLKPDGYFAMIVPDTIGEADYTKKLVELIIDRYSLYQIDFFPGIKIFRTHDKDVGVENKIIFVKNTKKIDACKRVLHEQTIDNIKQLGSQSNRNPGVFRLSCSQINFNFEKTKPLDRICYVSYGARFNSDKDDKDKFKKEDLISETKDRVHCRVYVEGKYIDRYTIKKVAYVEWGTERCPNRLVRPTFPELYPPKKLLMSRQKRLATYSDEGHICDNTIIVGVPYHELSGVDTRGLSKYFTNIKLDRSEAESVSKEFDVKYLLAIVNSELIRYFLNFDTNRSKIDSYPDDWKKIPIKNIPLGEQQKFVSAVDKMLSLNKRLNEFGDKRTEKTARINDEIRNIDIEIDNMVYELYGLSDDRRTIEGSLKKSEKINKK